MKDKKRNKMNHENGGQRNAFKTLLKERGTDFIAIAVATFLTPIVLMWIDKLDSALMAIPIFLLIMLLVAIIAGIIKRNKRMKNK